MIWWSCSFPGLLDWSNVSGFFFFFKKKKTIRKKQKNKTLRIIYKNETRCCIQINRYEITIAALSFRKHTDQMHYEKNNLKCWVYFQYARSIKICKLWSQCAGNYSTKMCNESCYYKCGSCIGTAVTAWYSLTLVQL